MDDDELIAALAAGDGGLGVAEAVDRYLDGVQAATTRASYAETLACLAAIAAQRDAGTLQPGDYAAVMAPVTAPRRPPGTGTYPR